jgi:pimeloyl-ACP methyl ester carboxylesterase
LGALVAAIALLAACSGNTASSGTASLVPPAQASAPPTTNTGATAGGATATGPDAAAPSSSLATAAGPPATAPPLADYTGDPFFDPGDTPAGAPGDIIRSRPVTVAIDGAAAWQVLHWSRTAEDQPVAVSATVVAPTATTSTPRAVLAWAHGTTGMGDQCSISARVADGSAPDLTIVKAAVGQGLTVVLPDYQGLGTPGDHAYLVGQAEGRNVLDGIRAATHLDGAGATPDSKAVVWGHSQGGQAAAFTAELQPTYAPDVHLVGAIAGAPASDLTGTGARAAAASPAYRGFYPMVVVGFRAGYPELAADDQLLADAGRQALAQADDQCLDETLSTFRDEDPTTLLAGLPIDQPRWQQALAANRAGDRPTSVPIFIYHGGADDLVPPQLSAELLARYCALGVTASRTVYPDTNHVSVIAAAYADIDAYLHVRLAGEAAPSSC